MIIIATAPLNYHQPLELFSNLFYTVCIRVNLRCLITVTQKLNSGKKQSHSVGTSYEDTQVYLKGKGKRTRRLCPYRKRRIQYKNYNMYEHVNLNRLDPKLFGNLS